LNSVTDPHLLAFSLQECMQDAAERFAGQLEGYRLVANVELKHRDDDLFATRLVICAHPEINIEIVSEQVIKTLNGGIGARNKGGVVLHLCLNKSQHIVLVGAHLAAHRKYNAERLKDLQAIMSSIPSIPSTVFLFGDLNFRLNFFGNHAEGDQL